MANENSNIIPAKEFDKYSSQRNDYANGEELMVLITLAEYRKLIADNAVAEEARHKLVMEGIEKDRQIKELKEQIVALKATITVSIKQEE